MLLYWDTIRAAAADGFGHFDFGRSTRDSGTYRFKRQWGAEERPLFWYRVSTGAGADTGAADAGSSAAAPFTAVWRHLPLSVTEHVGPYLRKYLVQ
jgi:CelD/BcsL family acetyltransferase involved in cellulose biosynthesis